MRGVEPPPSMLRGSNPDARYGAPPFEGGASTCSAKHRCSPCLLVKGTDCAGDVQRVAVVICRSLRVLFLGSHGSLEHVNVAVRTCPVLCGVPVLGTSPLNGQSPHRAMFAYPCSGKTTVGRLVGCM